MCIERKEEKKNARTTVLNWCVLYLRLYDFIAIEDDV